MKHSGTQYIYMTQQCDKYHLPSAKPRLSVGGRYKLFVFLLWNSTFAATVSCFSMHPNQGSSQAVSHMALGHTVFKVLLWMIQASRSNLRLSNISAEAEKEWKVTDFCFSFNLWKQRRFFHWPFTPFITYLLTD